MTLSRMDLFGLGMKLAYAISIHKAQGSEYETSILCTLSQSEFVERSMLYTAVSRSKRLALILSTQDIMQQGGSSPKPKRHPLCWLLGLNTKQVVSPTILRAGLSPQAPYPPCMIAGSTPNASR